MVHQKVQIHLLLILFRLLLLLRLFLPFQILWVLVSQMHDLFVEVEILGKLVHQVITLVFLLSDHSSV